MPLRVLFYPQAPRPEAVLTAICGRLGYRIMTDPDAPHDLALFWTTRTIRRRNATIDRVARRAPVLNLACRDIGKRHVDRVFRSVFGYGSLVDPRTHVGVCVRKSNLNAQHDGVVVRSPVRRVRATSVYQRVINNVVDGTFADDLRTPVFGDHIPFVYASRKPLKSRFGSPIDDRVVETADVLSKHEIENIRRFCRAMGLDYAELDVLRDVDDGRIVVVDANPTPWPPETMPAADLDKAFGRLSAAFERLAAAAIAGRATDEPVDRS